MKPGGPLRHTNPPGWESIPGLLKDLQIQAQKQYFLTLKQPKNRFKKSIPPAYEA
jgi:hypothetical protein